MVMVALGGVEGTMCQCLHIHICLNCMVLCNCVNLCSKASLYERALYVTGPAKIGHVGTNYAPPYSISYLSSGIEYFYSVTCTVKSTKCSIIAEKFMAKQYWNTKL